MPPDSRNPQALTRLELTVASGPVEGLSGSAAPQDRLLVGRAQNCQLQVIDPRMSREHFLTRFSQGRWWIEDLASSNGTLVNGHRIVAAIELRYGDIIQAGDTHFRVLVTGIAPTHTGAGSLDTVSEPAHPHDTTIQATVTDEPPQPSVRRVSKR